MDGNGRAEAGVRLAISPLVQLSWDGHGLQQPAVREAGRGGGVAGAFGHDEVSGQRWTLKLRSKIITDNMTDPYLLLTTYLPFVQARALHRGT